MHFRQLFIIHAYLGMFHSLVVAAAMPPFATPLPLK